MFGLRCPNKVRSLSLRIRLPFALVEAFAFCSPVHDLILVSQRGWKFAILLTHFVNLVRRMHRNPSKSFVLILFHRAAV
jgi:hypothetical protein